MLTQDELQRRRHYITATDVPAIMGLVPWQNAADVFLAKTRGVIKPTNDAMEAGNLLEPSVVAWAATKLGPLYPGDWKVAENGINAATLDAVTATGLPVECKTSGITGPGTPHQWGEDGTDEIPRYYIAQVQAQLLVTGAPIAYVPALIGGRGFVMFQVERNEPLIRHIANVSEQFWERHVLAGVEPGGVTASLETLKYLSREPGKRCEIADDLAAAFIEASERRKAAEKVENEAKSALIQALGDAEEGVWSGGVFTYLSQSRPAYEVKESTFRVLRQKAAKKTKV